MENIIANVSPVIWEWRFLIVAIIMLVVYSIFEWKKVKKILSENIIKARELAMEFVLESGQEQEDWVVERVYTILPAPVLGVLAIFGGKSALRKLVKIVYYQLKDYLDNQKLDKSWKE